MGVFSTEASSRPKKGWQGKVCIIGEMAGAKAAAHGNGGHTSLPVGNFWTVCLFPSHHFLLMQKPRAYVCVLIVHSQEVDPRRTSDMVQEKGQAQEYFEETRDTLQLFVTDASVHLFSNASPYH